LNALFIGSGKLSFQCWRSISRIRPTGQTVIVNRNALPAENARSEVRLATDTKRVVFNRLSRLKVVAFNESTVYATHALRELSLKGAGLKILKHVEKWHTITLLPEENFRWQLSFLKVWLAD
jgi:hypothetical protein